MEAMVTDVTPEVLIIYPAFWELPRSAAIVPPAPATSRNDISSLESRGAVLLHEVYAAVHTNRADEFIVC